MIDDHGMRDGRLKFLEMCEITSRRVVCAAIKKISSRGKDREQRHLSSRAAAQRCQKNMPKQIICFTFRVEISIFKLSGNRLASLLF